MKYGKIKTINGLRREIKRVIKKIDICYIREVIGAFLRRMHSVEKHDGELIINEYSCFLECCVVALKILYPYFIRLLPLAIS